MAGAILAVGAAAVTASLAFGFAAVGGAALAGQRLAGAADASALAAADAASGAASGVPCDRAAEVAQSDGAELEACAVDGLVATVTVVSSYARIGLRATARAGPPP